MRRLMSIYGEDAMKSVVHTALALAAAGLMLAACNTTAGIGKDISGAGNAISTGASSVQRAEGVPSTPSNNDGTVRRH